MYSFGRASFDEPRWHVGQSKTMANSLFYLKSTLDFNGDLRGF